MLKINVILISISLISLLVLILGEKPYPVGEVT